MFASAIAVGSALVHSLRHQFALGVKVIEVRRYWSKSINLALCYRGFIHEESFSTARAAGRAAFYCCAYDVISDWHNFDQKGYQWFKNLLISETSGDLTAIACRLFETERNRLLEEDGLTRGIDALRFVSGLIGSEEYLRSKFDFNYVGISMQIVDDVLDLKEDLKRGEINCLLASPSNRIKYLRTLLEFDIKAFKSAFPNAAVLCTVILTAQKKAAKMILIGSATMKIAPHVNRCPNCDVEQEQGYEVITHVRH